MRIPLLPNNAEQRAIGEALSDVDGLLGALVALIAEKRAIKQAAMQQLFTGKIRMKSGEQTGGYKSGELGLIPNDWKVQSLREGIGLFSGNHVIAQYCNTKGEGMPYLTGPADFPNGTIKQTKFTVRPTSICELNDILLTVKGSGAGTLIEADSVYCISRQLMAIRVRDWNVHFIFYSLLQNATKLKAASTGLIPGLSRSDILDQELPLPADIEEQDAIAEALSDVDGLLGSLEALIAKKGAIKQAAMQRLLTGKTRLPGFSRAWETKEISEVATYCNDKNSLAENIPVLTCSKHQGFVNSLGYFKNQVFSKDLRGYKIIRRGWIGYPANHIEEGSIGLQDLYDVALVSPIYIVCAPKAGTNSYFLHRLLKLDYYRREFATATTSSVDRRGSLRWPAFSKIVVNLPDVDEQTAIATVLSDIDAEIAALEQRRDKTRAIKQGMMQQLLTGRVRLVQSE